MFSGSKWIAGSHCCNVSVCCKVCSPTNSRRWLRDVRATIQRLGIPSCRPSPWLCVTFVRPRLDIRRNDGRIAQQAQSGPAQPEPGCLTPPPATLNPPDQSGRCLIRPLQLLSECLPSCARGAGGEAQSEASNLPGGRSLHKELPQFRTQAALLPIEPCGTSRHLGDSLDTLHALPPMSLINTYSVHPPRAASRNLCVHAPGALSLLARLWTTTNRNPSSRVASSLSTSFGARTSIWEPSVGSAPAEGRPGRWIRVRGVGRTWRVGQSTQQEANAYKRQDFDDPRHDIA